MNGLLYIHSPRHFSQRHPELGEEHHDEHVAARVKLAERMGFDVMRVVDKDGDWDPKTEAHVIHTLTDGSLMGVWLDIPKDERGGSVQRVAHAAHEAGMRVLGYQDSEESSTEIVSNIGVVIGVPGQE